MQDLRLDALRCLEKVIINKSSIAELKIDNSLTQELVYGVIRYYYQLLAIAELLLKKPFKAKDQNLLLIILLGIYQIKYLRIPEYAAVKETVTLATKIKKPWARALVNGVLREYLRRAEEISQKKLSDSACYAHSEWMIAVIKEAYPKHWEDILLFNNRQAPMSLRVNQLLITRKDYLALLKQHNIEASVIDNMLDLINLSKAMSVNDLPGFNDGLVSVQDGGAQMAARLLNLKPKLRVLDACAAPGGKTCHILECEPNLAEVVAIDINERRLERVSQNLSRLNQSVSLVCGDATQANTWWDQKLFDRILIDAPCSAMGVIRRHPDIKLNRSLEDVINITQVQQNILDNLWPLLKEGGLLLYVTCSILPAENELQIKKFLDKHSNAKIIDLNLESVTSLGYQILPSPQNIDLFYYALIEKVV